MILSSPIKAAIKPIAKYIRIIFIKIRAGFSSRPPINSSYSKNGPPMPTMKYPNLFIFNIKP